MSPAVRDRVVVITGAAGGLGQAITGALLAAGARLLLVDLDEPDLPKAARRWRGAPDARCTPLAADIATEAGRATIAATARRLGGADVLVNNAGIERASDYASLTSGEVRHAMEVNLLGAMLLSHALLPDMLQRRRGHIISIASMAAVKTVPHNAVYNAAKAGVLGFSTSLSKELTGTGVHATVICPSAVREVGMWARASERLPRNRLVQSSTIAPDDVAVAVLRALERRPPRILVASPLVRAGALLSAMSPTIDRLTDRISRIDAVYRRRIETDRNNRL